MRVGVLNGKRPKAPYKNARDHAILVGVQHYDAEIKSLQGPLNDCQLFAKWLMMPDGGGLDPAHIKYLCSKDPSDQQPARDQVETLLIDYFKTQANTGQGIGRRLYLFFSGHGVAPPVPEDDDCALVMANALLISLRSLIGGRAARLVRKAALFEEVVLIMDCCREVNGAVSAACDLIGFQPDPYQQPRPYFHVFAASWASTTAEQLLPDPFGGKTPSWHGVLTHALIRGLLTAPDPNGKVTTASLGDFIRSAVEAVSGGSTGHPRIEWDMGLPPLDFGASDGVKIDVILPAGASQLRVRSGTAGMNELQPKRRGIPGGVRVWLPPGLYLLEALDALGNLVSLSDCKVLEKDLNVSL